MDFHDRIGDLNKATEEMIAMRDPTQDVRSRQQRRFEARKGVREADTPQATSRERLSALTAIDRVPRRENTHDPAAWGGRLNIYTCDGCRRHIITRDVDEGTTPFMLRSATYCPGRCAEDDGRIMMTSSMYRVWDQSMREDFQWYKPESTALLVGWDREHVEKGGLLIRKAEHPV